MIELEYFNGEKWCPASSFPFYNEEIAWISLGGDDFNYRTVDVDTGKVLTTKSGESEMSEKNVWNKYKRKGHSIMRPYIKGEDLDAQGITLNDFKDNPDEDMGMIGRNPKDPTDMWYVARQYFKDHLELVEEN